MAQEVELKFLVETGGLAMLDSLPIIGRRLRRAPHRHIETTYFDTADRTFNDNGLALRVRKQDKGTLLSLKQAGSAAKPRNEWEWPIDGQVPGPKDVAGTPAEKLLKQNGAAGSLAPLYTVAVDRASFVVKEGSSRIEIAVDRGEIRHLDSELPVCEIELELKAGEPRKLFALARRFVDKAPLRLNFISKGDRGNRLANGSWGQPVGASTPKLFAEMSAATAFRTICHCCLYDFMLNEPAIDENSDIEGVHRARIAIRRLRAAFSLFRPMIADRDFDHLRREFSWLSDLLGEARDLDVMQCQTFEPPVIAGEAPLGADALLGEVARRRKRAHQALRQGLHSDRMRKLLLDIAFWLDHGQWRSREENGVDEPITSHARKLLDRRFRKLRKSARGLADASPEERHATRIKSKKLRYMNEFFASLVQGGKRRRRYKQNVRSLEKIQQSLGELHDAEARTDFLEALVGTMAGTEATSRSAVAAFAAGVFTAGERPQEKKLVRRAGKAFKRIARAKPFLKAG